MLGWSFAQHLPAQLGPCCQRVLAMVVSACASVDCLQATRKRKRPPSLKVVGDVDVQSSGYQPLAVADNSTHIYSTGVLNLGNSLKTSDPDPSNPSGRRQKRRRSSKPRHTHEYLKSRFNSIQDSDKWLLPTGRSVEEVLFNQSSKLDESEIKGSLHASYILLVSSANPQPSFFTADEWKVIKSSITPPPAPRSELTPHYSTAKFRQDLYSAVDKDIIQLGPAVNTDKEEEVLLRRWVRSCYEHYLLLTSQNRLSEHNSEGWLGMKLWSTFLDNCLLTIPQLDLDRGEISCRGTAERRNRNRTNFTVRKRIGRRMDGLFLLRGGNELNHELGGVECGKFAAGGEKGTKWLQDSQKLALAMRDMMVVLQQKYPTIRRKLRIVGVICLGLSLRIYIMENSCGQICTLHALDPVQIPVHYNPPLLEKFILEVIRLRDILSDLVEDLLDIESRIVKGTAEQVNETSPLIYSLDTDGGDGGDGAGNDD